MYLRRHLILLKRIKTQFRREVLTYETVKMLLPSDKVTNDFDWMRTEVGNLRDTLDTLMARQHEAQDQGEFLMQFITHFYN